MTQSQQEHDRSRFMNLPDGAGILTGDAAKAVIEAAYGKLLADRGCPRAAEAAPARG
jgi:hypothetical protein